MIDNSTQSINFNNLKIKPNKKSQLTIHKIINPIALVAAMPICAVASTLTGSAGIEFSKKLINNINNKKHAFLYKNISNNDVKSIIGKISQLRNTKDLRSFLKSLSHSNNPAIAINHLRHHPEIGSILTWKIDQLFIEKIEEAKDVPQLNSIPKTYKSIHDTEVFPEHLKHLITQRRNLIR